MPTTKFIWIDPGGTSGYTKAIYDREKRVLSFSYSQAKMNEVELFQFVHKWMPHILGYESFEYRSHLDKVDLTPCYLIGVLHFIQLMPDKFPITFYSQKPAMKDQFWTAHRLKDRGFYSRGLEHGRDSIRHLLQWFFFGAGAQFWMTAENKHPANPNVRYIEPECKFVPMPLIEMQWKT